MGVVGFSGRHVDYGPPASSQTHIDHHIAIRCAHYFHHFHSICYSIYIRLMYPEGWCKLLENICRALICENKGNCHPLNPILPCHIAHKWTYTGDDKMHSTNTQCYNSNILLDFPNGLCGYGANEHIPIIP